MTNVLYSVENFIDALSSAAVFFSEFFSCAIILAVCFVFLDKKEGDRFTVVKLIAWAAGIAALSSILQVLNAYGDFYPYGFTIAAFLPIILHFDSGLPMKLFVFASAVFTQIVFVGIFQVFYCTMFGETAEPWLLYVFIRLLVSVLAVAVSIMFIRMINAFSVKEVRDDTRYLLTLAPVIFSFMLVLQFVRHPIVPIVEENRLSFILWALILFMANFFIEKYVVMATERYYTVNELKMVNRFLDMEKDYFTKLTASLNETRILKHDMKHHIAVLNALNDKGDCNAIGEYLSRMSEGLEKTEVRRFCANDAVNVILSHYVNKAESMGITISTELSIPPKLNVDITELTVMWGNIMDNAIRAVSEDNDPLQSKKIKLVSRSVGDKTILMESNGYYGRVELDTNGYPVTTKASGGGFGIKSIMTIAEKYNGDVTTHFENNVFTIYVTMCGIIGQNNGDVIESRSVENSGTQSSE